MSKNNRGRECKKCGECSHLKPSKVVWVPVMMCDILKEIVRPDMICKDCPLEDWGDDE